MNKRTEVQIRSVNKSSFQIDCLGNLNIQIYGYGNISIDGFRFSEFGIVASFIINNNQNENRF